jgi:hypothetical protein
MAASSFLRFSSARMRNRLSLRLDWDWLVVASILVCERTRSDYFDLYVDILVKGIIFKLAVDAEISDGYFV